MNFVDWFNTEIIGWLDAHGNLYGVLILVFFLVLAVLIETLVRRIVLRSVENTKTDIDDEIVKRFRAPLIISLLFVGLHFASNKFSFRIVATDITDIAFITIAVVLWSDAVTKVIASFARQTGTDLDDEIVHLLRRPLAATVVFVGLHFIFEHLSFTILTTKVLSSILVTCGVALWTDAALKIARAVTERTKTTLDDEIVARLRRPLAATVIFVGIRVIIENLEFSETTEWVCQAILITIGVVLWAQAGIRVGKTVLDAIGQREAKYRLIQPRTLPLFDIILKIVVVAGAAYGILLAWHVDVTAWLASAGIVGIAVGFAAKDTLANLFAGIFIIADAPYKVGDFINLDGGERGMVTDIGIRSTRILTRDDIEITVPNAELGNTKIVNETGGPHEMERVRVNIGVAYGSDIDLVREILMDIADKSQYVSNKFEPRVRFRKFGDSSLDYQLMGWIEKPVYRGRAIDELCSQIYKRFTEAGIEIPFPQTDVHLDTCPECAKRKSEGSKATPSD